MEIVAVIMAGGVGSRFWPRSKAKKPKQLLRIFGENTMIQDTVARLDGLVTNENIYVITNRVQKQRVIDQLPEIPEKNIIAEPFGKNTAPCVGLASIIIEKKNPKSVIVTLPSDHLIPDVNEFQATIRKAALFAEKEGGLITIGIQPTRPETGYGYIQINEDMVSSDIYHVLTFAEKPNYSTAKRFLKSGDFLWNSGMFIWRSDVILSEINEHMPDLFSCMKELEPTIGTTGFDETLVKVYGELKSISIDYGIMEKSDKVYLVKSTFDWSDVGSWEAVYQLSDLDNNGNAKIGDVYAEDTFNSYIFNPRKFTAIIGVENLVVIETSDSLLICNRDNTQDVKNVVDFLKMKNKTELL